MKSQTANAARTVCALLVVASSSTTTTVMAQTTTEETTDPCFQDNVQLRNAVVEYVVDSSFTAEVSIKHDWPIGVWCVGNVTDFHDVFYRVDMNEDISAWDMSRATTLSNMFGNNTVFNQDISSWVREALLLSISTNEAMMMQPRIRHACWLLFVSCICSNIAPFFFSLTHFSFITECLECRNFFQTL
jgi:Mycoplasma protein of unknown function, DUF285